MKKILVIFALLLFCSIVLSDGMIFKAGFILDEASESAQVGLIDVTSEGYSLDLFVKVQANTTEDFFYWVVPLEQVPEKLELNNFEDSGFKQKVAEFDKGVRDARAYQSQLSSGIGIFTMGIFSSNPVGPFVWILSFFTMTMSSGGVQDSLASYDFGDLGSAEIFSADTEESLGSLLASYGIKPDGKIDYYLGKKIAVFKINNVEKSEKGLVARFEFNETQNFYYPSGTTQFFTDVPEQYAVLFIFPSNYILSENIKPLSKTVGKEKQYLVYGSNGFYGHLKQEELIDTDIHIEKTGIVEETVSFRKALAGFGSGGILSLGFIIGLIVVLAVMCGILKFRKKLTVYSLAKMILMYALVCVLVFSLLLLLLLGIPFLMGLAFMLSYASAGSALILVVLFFGLPLAIAISSFYGLFKWKKNFVEWAGFSRFDLWLVIGLVFAIQIIVAFLFALLP